MLQGLYKSIKPVPLLIYVAILEDNLISEYKGCVEENVCLLVEPVECEF